MCISGRKDARQRAAGHRPRVRPSWACAEVVRGWEEKAYSGEQEAAEEEAGSSLQE